MKRATDIYHRWVAWSEEDQTYIGRCPDPFRGGVHGDDPLKVARELQQVIDEWERFLVRSVFSASFAAAGSDPLTAFRQANSFKEADASPPLFFVGNADIPVRIFPWPANDPPPRRVPGRQLRSCVPSAPIAPLRLDLPPSPRKAVLLPRRKRLSLDLGEFFKAE